MSGLGFSIFESELAKFKDEQKIRREEREQTLRLLSRIIHIIACSKCAALIQTEIQNVEARNV